MPFLAAEMASILIFIMQFVDGDAEEDPGSDSEETEDEQAIVDQTNDDSIKNFESLSLVREVNIYTFFLKDCHFTFPMKTSGAVEICRL